MLQVVELVVGLVAMVGLVEPLIAVPDKSKNVADQGKMHLVYSAVNFLVRFIILGKSYLIVGYRKFAHIYKPLNELSDITTLLVNPTSPTSPWVLGDS